MFSVIELAILSNVQEKFHLDTCRFAIMSGMIFFVVMAVGVMFRVIGFTGKDIVLVEEGHGSVVS